MQTPLQISKTVKFEFGYTVILHFDPLFQHNPSPFVLLLCSLALAQRQKLFFMSSAQQNCMWSLVYYTLQQSAKKRRIQRVESACAPSTLTMMACAANYPGYNHISTSFVKLNRLGLPNVSVIQSFNFGTVVTAATREEFMSSELLFCLSRQRMTELCHFGMTSKAAAWLKC